ncbi:hypothetical protein [Agrococcus sp. DT81.2]|uniref:hypothetical protein n=1 Tax=Agrococcus sp. DT81.2 TaxID=3393414 RepID=UPI003CE55330
MGSVSVRAPRPTTLPGRSRLAMLGAVAGAIAPAALIAPIPAARSGRIVVASARSAPATGSSGQRTRALSLVELSISQT